MGRIGGHEEDRRTWGARIGGHGEDRGTWGG